MFRNLTASALILAALTGAASASSAQPGLNAGDVQLALSAGVEPGRYTRTELINILEARQEGETTRLNFYLSGANRTSRATGDAQLAAAAGVEPGEYSASELQRLIRAREDGDTAEIRFILSGDSRRAPNPAEVVTPGEAQLAASIGVDPAQYTLAELVALQPHDD
ncbi:hypothetical protein G5V65_01670 [Rhodobacter sp. HX-7-19]|uniref:Uncharacterized protein n=1 Tax=Paragemmobacter kunshanensis TaxID=2583234 RepID=A0A6M1TI97_9RHOB|nr:hypothetical protein [Rhodobacter kunshanensis]NGQ89589.1 hypothetical protein [Rhodobacter kunshanensis]